MVILGQFWRVKIANLGTFTQFIRAKTAIFSDLMAKIYGKVPNFANLGLILSLKNCHFLHFFCHFFENGPKNTLFPEVHFYTIFDPFPMITEPCVRDVHNFRVDLYKANIGHRTIYANPRFLKKFPTWGAKMGNFFDIFELSLHTQWALALLLLWTPSFYAAYTCVRWLGLGT